MGRSSENQAVLHVFQTEMEGKHNFYNFCITSSPISKKKFHIMYQFKGRIMIYFSLLFVLEYNSAITIKENINLGNLGNNSGTYISEGNNN